MTSDDFMGDIPDGLAARAHAGTSFTPAQRGEQERADYAATMARDWAALATFALTDEKHATLAAEFLRYREGYRRRFVVLLGAKGACVSTMIAGPSGFNVRRAEKRSATADRRLQDLVDFRERALKAIRGKLRPEDAPIMKGDDNAAERLRAKLEAAERDQARMRTANAAIRKAAKQGPAAQVAALVAAGFPGRLAAELLNPDWAGRLGFADYQLKNNSAEIRRLKGRLAEVERHQATPTTEANGEHARIEDNAAENRVRLFFPGKPAENVRAHLKRSGFRWTPSLGCWQAYRNHQTIATAREVAGVP
jgi:hypothetical protein